MTLSILEYLTTPISQPGGDIDKHLVNKWKSSGLLRELTIDDGQEVKVAHLLERESQWISQCEGKIPDLVIALFPLIRRVFGSLKFDITSGESEIIPLEVSLNKDLWSWVNTQPNTNRRDYSVEICESLGTGLRIAFDKLLQERGEIVVGTVPLLVFPTNSNWTFHTCLKKE